MALDFIPNKFYVARQPRNGDNMDEVLGFMQPMHKAGFTQRKKTADNWALPYGKNEPIFDPIEVENKPMRGFSLTANKRRYMNKNVVWRVLHPMGFEFEITSDNFSDFLMEIDMKEGIIQTEMIFVRRSGENYLTYVGSTAHKKAITEEQMTKSVSTKDIKPGDVVTLKNGDSNMMYLGAWHRLGFPNVSTYRTKEIPTFDPTKLKSVRHHYFVMVDEDGNIDSRNSFLHSFSSLGVNSIDRTGVKTTEECAAIYEHQTHNGYSSHEIVMSDLKPIKMHLLKSELTDVPIMSTGAILSSWTHGIDERYIVELVDGSKGFYYYCCSYGARSDAHRIYPVNETDISSGKMYTYTYERNRGYYGNKHIDKVYKEVPRDKIVKAYKVTYSRA